MAAKLVIDNSLFTSVINDDDITLCFSAPRIPESQSIRALQKSIKRLHALQFELRNGLTSLHLLLVLAEPILHATAVYATKSFNMASSLSLAERTFIITGANSGLGFETAKALARQDAHVIFAVKTKAKGDEAIRKIRQEEASQRAKLECMQVDLASFRLVRNLHSDLITPEGLLCACTLYGHFTTSQLLTMLQVHQGFFKQVPGQRNASARPDQQCGRFRTT